MKTELQQFSVQPFKLTNQCVQNCSTMHNFNWNQNHVTKYSLKLEISVQNILKICELSNNDH